MKEPLEFVKSFCKAYEASYYAVDWVVKGSLEVGQQKVHTFLWAVAVGGRSLVERAYRCQFLDQRVCRDRVDVLVSVRPSVFKKNG